MEKMDINMLQKMKEGVKERQEIFGDPEQTAPAGGSVLNQLKGNPKLNALFNKSRAINEKAENIDVKTDGQGNVIDIVENKRKPPVQQKQQFHREQEFVEAQERDEPFNALEMLKKRREQANYQPKQIVTESLGLPTSVEEEMLAQLREMDSQVMNKVYNKQPQIATQVNKNIGYNESFYQVNELKEKGKEVLNDIIVEMYVEEKIRKVVKEMLSEDLFKKAIKEVVKDVVKEILSAKKKV